MDATAYDGVYAALEDFKLRTRNGRPTVIICSASKGQGAFSDFMNRHKVVASDAQVLQEQAQHAALREARVQEFAEFWRALDGSSHGGAVRASLAGFASRMQLDLDSEAPESGGLRLLVGPVITGRVPHRDKRIRYDEGLLPRLDKAKQYSSAEIVTGAMKVFARDREGGFHRFRPGIDQRIASRSRRGGSELVRSTWASPKPT